MKFMGICGMEELECGCKTKYYLGGKVTVIGCIIHKEKSKTYHRCNICKKRMSKQDLKNHKWTHVN